MGNQVSSDLNGDDYPEVPNPKTGYEKYLDSSGAYSLEFPSDWVAEPQDQRKRQSYTGFDVLFRSPDRRDHVFIANKPYTPSIEMDAHKGNVIIKSYLSWNVPLAAEVYRKLSAEQGNFFGSTGFEAEWHGKIDQDKYHVHYACAITEGQIIQYIYNGEKHSWDNYSQQVSRHMLNSLEIHRDENFRKSKTFRKSHYIPSNKQEEIIAQVGESEENSKPIKKASRSKSPKRKNTSNSALSTKSVKALKNNFEKQ